MTATESEIFLTKHNKDETALVKFKENSFCDKVLQSRIEVALN